MRPKSGKESRKEQVVDQFIWLPFRKFASDKLISLPSQLGNGLCCQKVDLLSRPKVRDAAGTIVRWKRVKKPKRSCDKVVHRPKRKFFSHACFGPYRRSCKILHLQLHPLKGCQLFSQCDGALSPNAHKVVRLNDAHRRLSSVWFMTDCPCGCSRLVARGFQGLRGFQSPSSRWGQGYAGSCSALCAPSQYRICHVSSGSNCHFSKKQVASNW